MNLTPHAAPIPGPGHDLHHQHLGLQIPGEPNDGWKPHAALCPNAATVQVLQLRDDIAKDKPRCRVVLADVQGGQYNLVGPVSVLRAELKVEEQHGPDAARWATANLHPVCSCKNAGMGRCMRQGDMYVMSVMFAMLFAMLFAMSGWRTTSLRGVMA